MNYPANIEFQTSGDSKVVSERYLAIYWDFENIHISVKNLDEKLKRKRFNQEPDVVNINAVMEFLTNFGTVSINKAYCDWTKYSKYRDSLMLYSTDLIQMFQGGMQGKNGADIRLSIDLLEDMNAFPHLTDFVIIGSDVDYIGVAQKVRQKGKYIIGVGIDKSKTNRFYVQSCNRFHYYKAILTRYQQEHGIATGERIDVPELKKSKKLLIAAYDRTVDVHGEFAYKPTLKLMMQRLEPSFDESNFGCKNFTEYLNHFSGDFDIDLQQIKRKKVAL